MSRETDLGTLPVARMCRLFGLSRAAYYQALRPVKPAGPAEYAPERVLRGTPDGELVPRIQAIVAENAAWGTRKVWAMLRAQGVRVGHRRVWALMKAHGLTFAPARAGVELPTRGTVVTEAPNRRWATDLTTVWTKQDGVVAIMPVIDCGCRSVLALAVAKAQDAATVMHPVEVALWREFGSPAHVPADLELRTDHGPQYTSEHARVVAAKWGLDQTFAPVGRPTGNAVAERTIRTMKEECLWLRDWESLAEVETALAAWQAKFNTVRPHQALDWETPAARRARLLDQTRAAA